MTPAPLQFGQAPSELALNRAGLTPLAFANALRIGSSTPVYVAGLLRREPRIGVWSADTRRRPGGAPAPAQGWGSGRPTPLRRGQTPSRGSVSSCPTRPRRSPLP